MAIHTFFMFPETAGKTLEDIEEMFMEGVPAWKTKVDYTSRSAEKGNVDPEEDWWLRPQLCQGGECRYCNQGLDQSLADIKGLLHGKVRFQGSK